MPFYWHTMPYCYPPFRQGPSILCYPCQLQEPSGFTLPPPAQALSVDPDTQGRQQTTSGISAVLYLGFALLIILGSMAVEAWILQFIGTQLGVLAAVVSAVLALPVAMLLQLATVRSSAGSGRAGHFSDMTKYIMVRLLWFAGAWLGGSMFIAIIWAICRALSEV
jgi:hypothetical protein